MALAAQEKAEHTLKGVGSSKHLEAPKGTQWCGIPVRGEGMSLTLAGRSPTEVTVWGPGLWVQQRLPLPPPSAHASAHAPALTGPWTEAPAELELGRVSPGPVIQHLGHT